MTNLELFRTAEKLDAAWKKRQKIIFEQGGGTKYINGTVDTTEFNATHTVSAEVAKNFQYSPFAWALSGSVDLALQPEFEPGQVVVVEQPGSSLHGKCGVITGYALTRWGREYRILDRVYVDLGDGLHDISCEVLKKATIPKVVMDFLMAKFQKEGLKERVHQKVDEAFGSDELPEEA